MKICPICTLTAGTWISLLVWRTAGHPVDPVILATLMGGSVVGIASALDRGMRFKLFFIPVGFVAVYATVHAYWLLAGGALAVAVVSAVIHAWPRSGPIHEEAVREAEKKLTQCC